MVGGAMVYDLRMTDRRRDLLLRVMDGDYAALPFLHHFDSHFVRCDEILEWLIKNRLTGREFVAWTRMWKGTTPFSLGRFILSRVQKDQEQKIIHGKDWA